MIAILKVQINTCTHFSLSWIPAIILAHLQGIGKRNFRVEPKIIGPGKQVVAIQIHGSPFHFYFRHNALWQTVGEPHIAQPDK
jgi:hypothetical protein